MKGAVLVEEAEVNGPGDCVGSAENAPPFYPPAPEVVATSPSSLTVPDSTLCTISSLALGSYAPEEDEIIAEDAEGASVAAVVVVEGAGVHRGSTVPLKDKPPSLRSDVVVEVVVVVAALGAAAGPWELLLAE